MRANANKGVISILLAIILIAILIVAACAKPTSVTPTQPGETVGQKPSSVKIGYMEDMTGFYAAIGRGHLAGMEAKIARVNAAGGIEGVPIELTWADAGQDAGLAMSIYKKFKREGCLVVGALSTLHVQAIKGVASDDKTSVVAFAAGTDLYFPPSPYLWSYIGNHTSWVMSTLVPFNELWKKQYGNKPWKLGLCIIDHPMAHPDIPCIKKWCQQQDNVELIQNIEIYPVTALEFKSELNRLKEKGANAILLSGNMRWPVIRDMGQLGMLPGLEVAQGTKEIIWHDGGITPLATQSETLAIGSGAAGKWAKYCLSNRFEYSVFSDETGRPELAMLKEEEKEAFGELRPAYHAPFLWGWMYVMVVDAAIRQAVDKVGWANLDSPAVSEYGLPNLTVDLGGLAPYPLSTTDYPGDRSFVNYEGLARFNESWGDTETYVPADQWMNGDRYCWDHGLYKPLMEK